MRDRRDRALLEARFIEDFTVDEIAQKLGLSVARVKELLGRALRRARYLARQAGSWPCQVVLITIDSGVEVDQIRLEASVRNARRRRAGVPYEGAVKNDVVHCDGLIAGSGHEELQLFIVRVGLDRATTSPCALATVIFAIADDLPLREFQ